MDAKLNELIFVLAAISLLSWSVVGVTALLRAAAKLWYERRGRARLRQQVEEAVE